MHRTFRALALCGLAALGLCLIGCGQKGDRAPQTGATLEGTITYGKDRVPMAQIIVMGQAGMAYGTVNDDGRYKVENAPLGEVTLGVNTDAVKGDLMSKQMAESYRGPEGKGRGKASAVTFVNVPAKFADPGTSGIKTTVNKGNNEYNIVIK